MAVPDNGNKSGPLVPEVQGALGFCLCSPRFLDHNTPNESWLLVFSFLTSHQFELGCTSPWHLVSACSCKVVPPVKLFWVLTYFGPFPSDYWPTDPSWEHLHSINLPVTIVCSLYCCSPRVYFSVEASWITSSHHASAATMPLNHPPVP